MFIIQNNKNEILTTILGVYKKHSELYKNKIEPMVFGCERNANAAISMMTNSKELTAIKETK